MVIPITTSTISHDHHLPLRRKCHLRFRQWKLRCAWEDFVRDIYNFSNGPQNYGPVGPNSANQSENPIYAKASVSYQFDQSHLFYATYAKGFRVGGANAPLLPTCAPVS